MAAGWSCRAAPRHDALVTFLFVALGRAEGSVLRYSFALLLAGSAFPYATLIVNGVGFP